MSAHEAQDARSANPSPPEPTRKRPASAQDQGSVGGDQLETSDRHAADDDDDGQTQSGEAPPPRPPLKRQKKTTQGSGAGAGGKVHLELVNEEHDYRRGPPSHCPEIYDQIQKARRAGIGVGINDGVVIKYEPPEGRGVTPPPPPPVQAAPAPAPDAAAAAATEEQPKAGAEQAAHAAESSVPEASGGMADMQPAVTEVEEQQAAPTEEQEQAAVAKDALLQPEADVTKTFKDGSEPMRLEGDSGSSVRQTPVAPDHSALTENGNVAPQQTGDQPDIGRQMVGDHGEELQQQQIPQQHTQPVIGTEQVGGAKGLPPPPPPPFPRQPRRGDADIKRIGRKRLQVAFPFLGPFRRIRTWAGPHTSAPSIRRTSVADKLSPHPGFSRPGRRLGRGPQPMASYSSTIVKQQAQGPQDVPLQSIEEAPPQTEARGDEAVLSKRGRGRPRGRKASEPPGTSAQRDSRQPSVASSVATRRSTRKASVASTRASSVVETDRSKITRKGRARTTTTTKASSRGPAQLETVAEEEEEEEEEGEGEGDDPKIKIEEDEGELEVGKDFGDGQEPKGRKKTPASKKTGAAKSKAAEGKAGGSKKSSTKAATKKSTKKS